MGGTQEGREWKRKRGRERKRERNRERDRKRKRDTEKIWSGVFISELRPS